MQKNLNKVEDKTVVKTKVINKMLFLKNKAKISSGHYKNSNKTSSCFPTAEPVRQTWFFFNLKVIDKPLFQDKKTERGIVLILFKNRIFQYQWNLKG